MRIFVFPFYLVLSVFVFVPFVFAQGEDETHPFSVVLENVYAHHPTLMAARAELRATQELYPQARAGWLPSVSAEASVFASHIESSNFGTADGAVTKDISVRVDQPIWRGGRTFVEVDRALSLIAAAEAMLVQEEQDLYFRAVQLYMDVIRKRLIFDLYVQNENILLQEYKAVQERLKIGDVTLTDVQQTKASVARVRADTIEAENDLAVARSLLEEIAGSEGADDLDVPVMDFEIPNSLNEMIDSAIVRNPEMAIARFEYAAAEHNSDAAFRELLPQISAFASYNKQFDPQPGIVDESATEMIGVRASLALYDGGAIRSRKRQAVYNAKRQGYIIEDIERQVRQDVQEYWYSYRSAEALSESRFAEIEAVEASLAGVREESLMGQRTILDVLDADQNLINAQIALVGAQCDEVVAYYALVRALGILQF